MALYYVFQDYRRLRAARGAGGRRSTVWSTNRAGSRFPAAAPWELYFSTQQRSRDRIRRSEKLWQLPVTFRAQERAQSACPRC